MAIGSHGADGGTVFIDAHAVMGVSCEGARGVPFDRAFMCSFTVMRVCVCVIRESHCGPLALCTHAHEHTSGYASP